MFWIILLIIVVGIIWYSKIYRASVKQFSLTFNYLTMLILACKTKDDFEKLLWRMYSFDSDTVPADTFNTKWGAICEAAHVPIYKEDYGGMQCVSPIVIETIAENIYNDPQNKRYIIHIDSLYPDSMTLDELKKHQVGDK